MQTMLYNQQGKEVGTTELPETVFGVKWNAALVKQVVEAERANRRQSIAHTKTRGEVRGGGKKPWRQKGTGRARQGSIRSPLWKGGGTTFGPRSDKDFSKKVNKRMARQALFVVLSAKMREGECRVLDRIDLEKPKTKEFAHVISNLGLSGKSMAFVSTGEKTTERAARNIKSLAVLRAQDLNALDLLQSSNLLMPQEAIRVIEKTFVR